MGQKYRVRLSSTLAARVTALADSWGLPTATLMRLAILDLTQHPERIPELMLASYASTQDETSTPEQTAATAQYLQSLVGYDLAAVLGEVPHDMGDEEGYK